jgi:antirestriction protein
MKGINWLIEVLNNVRPDEFCSIEKIKELCHQAKEMEEQEIIYTEEDMGKAIIFSFDTFSEALSRNEMELRANEFIQSLKKIKL